MILRSKKPRNATKESKLTDEGREKPGNEVKVTHKRRGGGKNISRRTRQGSI